MLHDKMRDPFGVQGGWLGKAKVGVEYSQHHIMSLAPSCRSQGWDVHVFSDNCMVEMLNANHELYRFVLRYVLHIYCTS